MLSKITTGTKCTLMTFLYGVSNSHKITYGSTNNAMFYLTRGKLFCVLSGIVGEIDDEAQTYHIWTHKKFSIGFNGNQIVDVNLTSEGKERLTPNTKLQFSYEVRTQYKHHDACNPMHAL